MADLYRFYCIPAVCILSLVPLYRITRKKLYQQALGKSEDAADTGFGGYELMSAIQ